MLKYMIQKGYVNVSKIILSIYPELGLQEDEVVVVLKLFEMLKNNQVTISVSELSKKMAMEQTTLSNVLASLFNKDLLTLNITYSKEGKAKESFSLDNLIDKMSNHFNEDIKVKEEKNNQQWMKQVVSLVEESFKRSLSNLDIEMINSWAKEGESIDHIRQALAISLKNGKTSIKYVDACLANLDKKENESEYVLDDNKSKLLADFYRNIK